MRLIALLVLALSASLAVLAQQRFDFKVREDMFAGMDGDTAAFDRAMKEPPPPPRRPDGEVQPDGTVRYGSMVMTVRNPCPPGTHYEPPPLPGRAVRK